MPVAKWIILLLCFVITASCKSQKALKAVFVTQVMPGNIQVDPVTKQPLHGPYHHYSVYVQSPDKPCWTMISINKQVYVLAFSQAASLPGHVSSLKSYSNKTITWQASDMSAADTLDDTVPANKAKLWSNNSSCRTEYIDIIKAPQLQAQ